jgi:serine/threonine-protein kinase RsbW
VGEVGGVGGDVNDVNGVNGVIGVVGGVDSPEAVADSSESSGGHGVTGVGGGIDAGDVAWNSEAGAGAEAGSGAVAGTGPGVRSQRIEEEVGVDGDGVGVGAESVPVTLRIPADRDFVVLVRSAAGHLGARAGFSMAEMQDWRLAVDEACGLLLLPDEVDATGEELECVFRLDVDGVAVTVSAEARPGSKPQVGGFGWSLLAALVDGLNWAEEDGRVRVDIVKRAAGADGGRRTEAR